MFLRKNHLFKVFIVFITLIVFFTSCDIINSFILEADRGSILIQFNDEDVENRSLLPELSMDIASYTVTGEGPDGTNFTEEVTGSDSFSRNDLIEGDWSISVEAYNGDAEPVLIGQGIQEVTILAGQVTETGIEISPLSGTGVFELSVDWDKTLTSPVLDFTLTNSADEAVSQTDTFTITDQQGSLSIPDLSTGYYLLEVTLTEDGNPIGHTVETLRIVNNQRTSGTLSIITDDTGDLAITISQLMDDPITVTLEGTVETLSHGTDMTVIANTSEEVDEYAWYLNGIRLSGETSDSITIGSELDDGNYQLTNVVWKGNVVCSKSNNFSITSRVMLFEEDYESFSEGSFPSDYYIAYNGAGNSSQYVDVDEENNKYLKTQGATSWGLTIRKDFVQDFPEKVRVDWKMQTQTDYNSSNFNTYGFASVSGLYIKNAEELVMHINLGNKSDNNMYAYTYDPIDEESYCVQVNRYEWVDCSLIIDFKNLSADVYINDTFLASDIPLRNVDLSSTWNSFSEEASISFHSGNNSSTITLFDDIKLYELQ